MRERERERERGSLGGREGGSEGKNKLGQGERGKEERGAPRTKLIIIVNFIELCILSLMVVMFQV